MFGNWLNGVLKEFKSRIRIGVSKGFKFFAGTLNDGALDSAMVLPSPGGGVGAYGYLLAATKC
jgi:hypothetical protein